MIDCNVCQEMEGEVGTREGVREVGREGEGARMPELVHLLNINPTQELMERRDKNSGDTNTDRCNR